MQNSYPFDFATPSLGTITGEALTIPDIDGDWTARRYRSAPVLRTNDAYDSGGFIRILTSTSPALLRGMGLAGTGRWFMPVSQVRQKYLGRAVQ